MPVIKMLPTKKISIFQMPLFKRGLIFPSGKKFEAIFP